MIVLRSAVFNLFFFGATFALTLAGTVVRFLAPHRVLGVAAAWARLVLWRSAGHLRHTLAGGWRTADRRGADCGAP